MNFMMNRDSKSNQNRPVREQTTDIELDGTIKRGGLPVSTLKIKDRFDVTETEVFQKQGQRIKMTAIISGALETTIAKVNDFLVTIDDLAVTRNVELPSAAKVGKGKLFKVKDLVGGAATTTITIASKEGETIDGAATTTLTTDYEFKSFVSNGTNWFTI